MVAVSPPETGHRLEEFIRSKGWTKKEFAEHMHISPANVSKYIKGVLDVQHIVVPLIANGCDVTKLFFNGERQPDTVESTKGDGQFAESILLQELTHSSGKKDGKGDGNKSAGLQWLQVSKQNGMGVYPILASGDRVLLSRNAHIKDGDLVAAKVGIQKETLKIAYFDGGTVMLRSINPTVRPLALEITKVTLSKVVLVKKK